ncbi:Nucleolar protein 16 [Trichinella nativa]|uniref:Nucleolar protein 16 n=1 Tax=Trichinella nativa TaxID=6335 RepID=A0A0V1L450_9BILA|nr:Nucleolar protein 16 [Trichinella nativa]
MARSTKRGGKKNRKVVFRKNRLKNKWKNEKRKRGIRVQNNLIQQVWDNSASNKKNMRRMGLVFDVNSRLSGMANENVGNNENNQTSKFIETFEEELKKRCVKSHYLPISELKFLVYMMEKHGEDFEAMARDSRNYFQRTSGQMRRAIQAFKKMPIQYNAYLRLKNAATSKSKWADCLLKSHSNILTRKNAVNTKAMNARVRHISVVSNNFNVLNVKRLITVYGRKATLLLLPKNTVFHCYSHYKYKNQITMAFYLSNSLNPKTLFAS